MTILLAEDHPVVLLGLIHLFERYPEFTVVRGCRNGEEALAAVQETSPDVLVLDVRMPGASGLDVLRGIAEKKLSCHTVIWTAGLQDGEAAAAMKLGVKGIVLKESSADALLDCVRRVHQGGTWFDPAALTRTLDAAAQRGSGAPASAAALTPREMDVVRLVAEGLRNRDIAERLVISEGTVKIHLHNMYEKLGLSGRLELVLYAQGKGLV